MAKASEPVAGVEGAVQGDLAALPTEFRESALALTALALAREIDVAGNSATSKSMCARALFDALEKLRALVPDEPEVDKLDELGARRSKRRAGGAKAAG